MSTIKTRPTNGVSYGIRHTVTSGDATDAVVTFDFRVGSTFRFDLVATVQVLAATTGVVTNPVDLAVTYPEKGIVRVAGTLVAGSVINLVAQAVQV